MTAIIIISIISIIVDGILTNYLPYLVNDLTLFTPMFTVILTFILYPLFFKNNKNYLIYLFILGIIYDLLYTNLLFFNGFIFVFLGYISIFIYKNFPVTVFRVMFYLILIIIIYESTFALCILIFDLVPITFDRLIYKISHSIILNIIYGLVIYLITLKIVNKNRSNSLCNFRTKIR